MMMSRIELAVLLASALFAPGAPASAAPPASPAPAAAPASGTHSTPAGKPRGPAASSGYRIEVKTLAAQPAVTVRGSAPASELEARLAAVFPRILVVTSKHKLEVAGPPFVRYELASGATTIEFEAGLPVYKVPAGVAARAGAAAHEVRASELPAGPAAVVEHQGPYQGLPAAHAALAAWVQAHGRAARGAGWVVFMTNPLIERNPAKLRSKVFLPLVPLSSPASPAPPASPASPASATPAAPAAAPPAR